MGGSIQDILSMDYNTFNQMGEKELRKAVSQLASAGNKRLRRLESAGINTPASRYVEKSGGSFSTKGKSLNELRSEYTRIKGFMESKTGSLKGYREVEKQTIKGLAVYGIGVDKSSFQKFWRAYEKLKSMSPEIENKALKYQVLREIADEMEEDPEKSIDVVVDSINSRIEELYEEEAGREDDSVSKYFKV